MKYLIGIIGLFILGALAWTFINPEQTTQVDSTTTAPSLTIVTSIYPLAYITERIVGERGTVNNIGANQDPHDFRPTAQDIQSIVDADLVILQGAELEPWGEDIQEQLKGTGTQLILVADGLDLFAMEEDHHDYEDEHKEEHHDEDEYDDHGHGHYDPHTWLDPVLMIKTSKDIARAIIELDPNNEDYYMDNLDRLQQDLTSLDTSYREGLSQCEINEVITSHDAFGYLGRRYGFEIHAIGGLSTQDTPSAVTLAQLKEEAEEGITTILLEENSIAAYGEALAEETGLETASISPIVYNIPQGQDYLDMMRSNLRAFRSALACNE